MEETWTCLLEEGFCEASQKTLVWIAFLLINTLPRVKTIAGVLLSRLVRMIFQIRSVLNWTVNIDFVSNRYLHVSSEYTGKRIQFSRYLMLCMLHCKYPAIFPTTESNLNLSTATRADNLFSMQSPPSLLKGRNIASPINMADDDVIKVTNSTKRHRKQTRKKSPAKKWLSMSTSEDSDTTDKLNKQKQTIVDESVETLLETERNMQQQFVTFQFNVIENNTLLQSFDCMQEEGLLFSKLHRGNTQNLDVSILINLEDQKVVDVLLFELISSINQAINKYSQQMSKLNDSEDSATSLLALQRGICSIATELNMLFISSSALKSPMQPPSKPNECCFLFLHDIDSRSFHALLTLMVALIEEICLETKKVLEPIHGETGIAPLIAQHPLVDDRVEVGDEFELVPYCRLPMLAEVLDFMDNNNQVECSEHQTLRQAIVSLTTFFVQRRIALKALDGCSSTSKRSPLKSPGMGMRKIDSFIKRIKAMYQQLIVVAGNAMNYSPPLVS
jgi:hypothetical protein